MAQTASVTYLHHSGLLLRAGDVWMLFDYWRGEDDLFPEAAFLRKEDFADCKKLIIFVSHSHPDHFDRVIYQFAHYAEDVSYVVSDDVIKEVRKDAKKEARADKGENDAIEALKTMKALKVGDTFEKDGAKITAFGSTDIGVSFYIEVGGLTIFHAGDLNLWHWREESSLPEIAAAETAYYDAVAPLALLPMDIAMFPIDPRMGGLFDAGANHFIMAVKPRVFLPIHWQSRPEVALDFARRGRTKYTEVLALTKPRERADITFGERDLNIHIFTLAADAYLQKPAVSKEVAFDAYDEDDPFSDTDLPVSIT